MSSSSKSPVGSHSKEKYHAHMARAKAADKEAKKHQTAYLPNQALDFKELEADQGRLAEGQFPRSWLFPGKYLLPDPRDTDLAITRQLVNPQTGSTPYGIVHTDSKDLVKYVKDKKAQETNLFQLQLASQLIDPNRPETQEYVFKKFPQLVEIPEEAHRENIMLQETLRTLLRDGIVRDPKDNALVAHIIQSDF